MLEEIANVEVPPGVPPLNMRIGLHVGRVVAGVVGTKKYRYDIWGKDVMTALLMESHGVPGEVCVSEALLKYLDGDFEVMRNPLHEVIELPHAKAADGHEGTINSYQLVRRTADGALAPPIVKPLPD
jgi:class 3 adenylate cyclase